MRVMRSQSWDELVDRYRGGGASAGRGHGAGRGVVEKVGKALAVMVEDEDEVLRVEVSGPASRGSVSNLCVSNLVG